MPGGRQPCPSGCTCWRHSPEYRAKLSEAARRRYSDQAERDQAAERQRRVWVEHPELAERVHASVPRGERHSNWSGDELSYNAAHQWVGRRYPKTGTCEHCGATPEPRPTRHGMVYPGTHWAFLRHPEPHTRNREDYVELCAACHAQMDRAKPE